MGWYADRDQLWALVDRTINFGVTQNVGRFLSS
jgi:hypothetical protein